MKNTFAQVLEIRGGGNIHHVQTERKIKLVRKSGVKDLRSSALPVKFPPEDLGLQHRMFFLIRPALLERYSIDDSPYTTDIQLEEGAAGKTDIDAMVVMDGISGARVSAGRRVAPTIVA